VLLEDVLSSSTKYNGVIIQKKKRLGKQKTTCELTTQSFAGKEEIRIYTEEEIYTYSVKATYSWHPWTVKVPQKSIVEKRVESNLKRRLSSQGCIIVTAGYNLAFERETIVNKS